MEGMQGMVYKVTEELPNAQEQITSAISIVLADYLEARHLFHKLLTNASMREMNFADIAAAKAFTRDIRDINDSSYMCTQYI
eukprot:10187824-Ditylum_brightwellii.AAC.1